MIAQFDVSDNGGGGGNNTITFAGNTYYSGNSVESVSENYKVLKAGNTNTVEFTGWADGSDSAICVIAWVFCFIPVCARMVSMTASSNIITVPGSLL